MCFPCFILASCQRECMTTNMSSFGNDAGCHVAPLSDGYFVRYSVSIPPYGTVYFPLQMYSRLKISSHLEKHPLWVAELVAYRACEMLSAACTRDRNVFMFEFLVRRLLDPHFEERQFHFASEAWDILKLHFGFHDDDTWQGEYCNECRRRGLI